MFIINTELIFKIVLVFPFLTLNKEVPTGQYSSPITENNTGNSNMAKLNCYLPFNPNLCVRVRVRACVRACVRVWVVERRGVKLPTPLPRLKLVRIMLET